MIDQRQMDKICDLLVNYRKAIVDVTTATPKDRLEAAYEFANIDQMIHELLGSWVSDESPIEDKGCWTEWWHGARAPASDVRVEVKTECGVIVGPAPAKDFLWDTGRDYSPAEYRVVPFDSE